MAVFYLILAVPGARCYANNKIHGYTNFYDNRLNGVKIATLQRHMVASGINELIIQTFSVKIYIYTNLHNNRSSSF